MCQNKSHPLFYSLKAGSIFDSPDINLPFKEVTLDLSDSMRKIVRSCFCKASRVIDRFHIQKLACNAVQEMRIKLRWDAIQEANEDMEEARFQAFNVIAATFYEHYEKILNFF